MFPKEVEEMGQQMQTVVPFICLNYLSKLLLYKVHKGSSKNDLHRVESLIDDRLNKGLQLVLIFLDGGSPLP